MNSETELEEFLNGVLNLDDLPEDAKKMLGFFRSKMIGFFY